MSECHVAQHGLPSPTEMLHGRSSVTKGTTVVDFKQVRAILMKRQAGQTKAHDKSHQAKAHRKLVMRERYVVLSKKNQWYHCFITGIGQDGRCYSMQFEETGQTFRRTWSHIKPLGPDIPQLHPSFLSGKVPSNNQNSVLSEVEGGEIAVMSNEDNIQAQNLVLSGPNEATNTASFLIPGRKVRFNTEDQVRHIRGQQGMHNNSHQRSIPVIQTLPYHYGQEQPWREIMTKCLTGYCPLRAVL